MPAAPPVPADVPVAGSPVADLPVADLPVADLPVAVDAMGGDLAPDEIVAGAQAAVDAGLAVVLVGDPGRLGDTGSLPVISASEAIGMHDDPGRSVRTKKDSSLVRAAEAVRDGRAAGMVSAGNTGATMAAALLRMGRVRNLARPAIATPIPVPGTTPTVLLDSGANAECTPAWLVQFAQMGAVVSRHRYGIVRPRVGLLSIGEEATKGNSLVKDTHEILAAGGAGADVEFVGNVEGRDVMTDAVNVVVTDGFTGNVVLKTLEGAMRFAMRSVLASFDTDEQTKAAGAVLLPALLPFADQMDPDSTGGALLAGVSGVCVISHGSSGARAIVNAVAVAHAAAAHRLVEQLAAAVAAPD